MFDSGFADDQGLPHFAHPQEGLMHPKINFDNLLISASYGPESTYESVEAFESYFPYIRELEISFALESENGEQQIVLYGEKQRAEPAGVLSGTLVLGRQAFLDGEALMTLCDDYSADLCVVATELEKAEALNDFFGICCDIFSIHSLELSQELVDAANLRDFFDRIPRFVLQNVGVLPQICCNLIADVEGYYERQEEQTNYDPRSTGKESIRIFAENGYQLTKSGKLLIRAYDEDTLIAGGGYECDCRNEVVDLIEESTTQQSQNFIPDEIEAMQAAISRHILEDHIQVGLNASAVHVPRDAPKELIKYVHAATIAHNLGTTFDHAFNHFLPEEKPNIPAIHLAFQEMYYTGIQHMDETLQRMNPQVEPNAGEVFSDAALSRARNTYYVAALLYREGHMIEAHAMSRLMLEQIAWSFSVFEKQDRKAAEKVLPTKAIGKLKKKIEPVGKLYGMLSQYVHLPLKGHDEFINLSSGKSSTLMQFGAHSYYFGQILAHLADYWADIYEYTQARHFKQLENWIEEPSGLVLSPNRPFKKTIDPLLENLKNIYAEQYPTYEDFLKSNWTIKNKDGDTSATS